MLKVYHSNRLDILKTIIESILDNKKLLNPFDPEIILVQSVGMSQWLKISLSQKFGISANIKFLMPSNFIWDMFFRVLPNIPKKNAFNKKNIMWKLMSIIPKMLSRNEFSTLKDFLSNDIKNRKIFQLSSRTADLYDQYLTYRPEWFSYWESGKLVKGLSNEQAWQALLWQELIIYTKKLGQPHHHLANLYNRFVVKLETEKQDLIKLILPSRIFVCGISTLPPFYLTVLQALSKYINIHILVTNPCRHYWGDIQDPRSLSRLITRNRCTMFSSKKLPIFKDKENAEKFFDKDGIQNLPNPLLASWGKIGSDYVHMLTEITSSNNNENIDAFSDITQDNLLHNLQKDLLNLENHAISGINEAEFSRSDKKRLLNINDRSITINVCHSIQREVEVLHDRLLTMLEEDPELNLREIVVMVSDIDKYSPFIQAIFGSATKNRYLPYTVSDRCALMSHTIFQVFIKLLSLPDVCFISEDVFSLLDEPSLALRFNINEKGLQYLRQLVIESGVRWGMNDDNAKNFDLPVTGQHTWKFGLTRILLSYAMDSHLGDWNGVLPYDKPGNVIGELIGNLAFFLTILNNWRDKLILSRKLNEWILVCKEIINDFFLPDKEAESALLLIEKYWNSIIEYGINSQYEELVSISLLRNELKSKLDQESISNQFLTGSINICNLIPMRSIPFKVICLLGMNDKSYPRDITPVSFDLMYDKPHIGDKNCRDEDCYIFLEALTSAKKIFYISYIGRSIQDNQKCFPSVLVKELTDYIGQSYYLPGDELLDCDQSESRVKLHITLLHNRMPFDSKNYIISEQQSHVQEWLPAAKKSGKTQVNFIKKLKPLHIKELDFENFQKFWIHPVREFFKIRLQVNFISEKNKIFDSEPFNIDIFDQNQLNKQMLDFLVKKKNIKELFHIYRSSGKLPYGVFGEIVWEKQYEKMKILSEKISKYYRPGYNMEIDFHVADVHTTGWIKNVQQDGILRWSHSSYLSIAQGMKLWLEHLVYCAIGGNKKSRLLFGEKGEWRFSSIPKEEAFSWLTKFVEGYKRGMTRPLLLLPESAGSWMKVCYDKKSDMILSDEETLKKARDKFFSTYQGNIKFPGENKDIWYQRLWKSINQDDFFIITKEAKRYLFPLLKFNES